MFLLSSFFIHIVTVHVVLLFSKVDTPAAGKNSFILSNEFEFHMMDNQSIYAILSWWEAASEVDE